MSDLPKDEIVKMISEEQVSPSAVDGSKGGYVNKTKLALRALALNMGLSDHDALETLYSKHNGTHVAKLLGIERQTLYRLLRAHGIPIHPQGGADPSHKITIEARVAAEARGMEPVPLRVAKGTKPSARQPDPTPRLPSLPSPRPLILKKDPPK